jgi:23S rRNA pseudouridine2605 synthase
MSKKTAKTGDIAIESTAPRLDAASEPEVPATVPVAEVESPMGDEPDREAESSPAAEAEPEIETEAEAEQEAETEAEVEPEAEAAEVEAESTEAEGEAGPEQEEDEPEFTPKPGPPAKLERLQKILAQAGIASRRKAEEMIEQGRVQVNGTVVTELGTKADAGRDHIRVDGKLLQGSERLRYFVLNKPKGFVTTVKDPEGRPTVMQFFEKMKERLYPVGRLDYMSEGLLLVTNDGELANKLTKAGSGVEKTYLVKVAGQPSEDELNILRGGVAIERGKPGSPHVRTSPARIRQVRQGDNPWFEVVLIEGRNRELRKMFEAVGHFVEKIRRVGYGPLVLDQEPGSLRELQPAELTALRLASEGKARTPKSKELRRRNALDATGFLPTVAPRPSSHPRPAKPYPAKAFEEGAAAAGHSGELRPKRSFGAGKPFRTARPAAGFGADEARPSKPYGDRPATGRTFGAKPAGARSYGSKPEGRTYGSKPAGRTYGAKPDFAKPAWKKEGSSERPAYKRPAAGATGEARPPRPYGDRPAAGRTFGAKPAGARSYGAKPAGRTYGAKPAFAKPAWKKEGGSERPAYKRPAAGATGETRPGKPYGDRPAAGRTFGAKPAGARPYGSKPEGRTYGAKPAFAKPAWKKEGSSERPAYKRPAAPRREAPSEDFEDRKPTRLRIDAIEPAQFEAHRPAPSRPRTGGLARPFTTSSGKPRAGGARPSSKPGSRTGSSARPAGKTGWKPKPGGFSKSGFKGKPGGAKRTGPGGKKRG